MTTMDVADATTREVGGPEFFGAFHVSLPRTGSVIGLSRATGTGRTSLLRLGDVVDLSLPPPPP